MINVGINLPPEDRARIAKSMVAKTAASATQLATVILQTCDPLIKENVALDCKLRVIEAICRKHNTPASNVGAHALARKILEVIERPVEL
jgi:hypothetical protein